MATFSVTCSRCLHQQSFPTRVQANSDAAEHAQAYPTHAPTVHNERDERDPGAVAENPAGRRDA